MQFCKKYEWICLSNLRFNVMRCFVLLCVCCYIVSCHDNMFIWNMRLSFNRVMCVNYSCFYLEYFNCWPGGSFVDSPSFNLYIIYLKFWNWKIMNIVSLVDMYVQYIYIYMLYLFLVSFFCVLIDCPFCVFRHIFFI